MRMDDVVKVDEMKREREGQSVEEEKQRKKLFKES